MKKNWNITKSDELYNTSFWGNPYFSLNRRGEIYVHPKGKKNRSFSLKTLVDQIVERNIPAPFLLRFNDILLHRLTSISEAFDKAKDEYNFKGKHSIIYPIKVNQQKHVVDQIAQHNLKHGHGLEAGSKPELLAIMAISKNQKMPIVCNGYKDEEYLEIALMGTKIGKPIYPVIEKFSELKTLIKLSKRLKIIPDFGVRIKLSTSGSGRWQKSGGFRSKFGLTINELMRGISLLKQNKMLSGFKLLHFHQGSQITDISTLKKSIKEGSRVYAELIKLGVPLSIIDVGGGLGVDYNGMATNHDSSANYNLQEYANDIIFQLTSICDEAGVSHPDIFMECGRAVCAHHAVLIFEILGYSGFDRTPSLTAPHKKAPKPIKELFEIKQELKKEKDVNRVMEHYHDAIANFQECQNLFGLGYMTIKDRGLAEELYFSSLKRCLSLLQKDEEYQDEVKDLEEILSDIYFGNFSVFQSLPDLWAIGQQFPVMPIHRLNEEPTQSAIIADITCDSDGKIDSFISTQKENNTLKLHTLDEKEEYYLGVFLVGAYQETLGDLHNLFGDTNAVHISIDHKGKPVIDTIVKGDTVKEVLSYMQYDVKSLLDDVHKQMERAVREGRITFKESGKLLSFYESAIEGYTYLEDWVTRGEY